MSKISRSNAGPWFIGFFLFVVISYSFIVFFNIKGLFICLNDIEEIGSDIRKNYSFIKISHDHKKIESIKKYFDRQIAKYKYINVIYLLIEDANDNILQIVPENLDISTFKSYTRTKSTSYNLNTFGYQLDYPVIIDENKYVSLHIRGNVINFFNQAYMIEIYFGTTLVFLFFTGFYIYRQSLTTKKIILNRLETEKILAEKLRIDGIISRFARSALLSSSIDEASVYASEAIRQLIGGEYIFAGYIDEKNGSLNIILNNSINKEILSERGFRKKINDFYGIWGKALHSGESFYINSLNGEDARLPGRNSDYMAKSALVVPALVKGKSVGIVLSADRKSGFSKSDEKSLKRIAEIYAVCIQKEIALMKVKERERQFRLLFKTNPDAVIITSLDDDVIVDVNDGFLNLTGYKSQDIKSKKTSEISLWNDFKDRAKMLSSVEEEGKIVIYETKFKFNNRKSLTVLVSASKIYLNGKPHLFSVVREIEKLKQIENELRTEREFFSKVLHTSPSGIMAVDGENLRILHVNQRISEIMGLEREEIQGKFFYDEIWDIRDFNLNKIKKSSYISNLWEKKKETFTKVEYAVMGGAGKRIYLSLNATPIIDQYGNLSMFVISMEDVSQKVLSEKTLREIEERLDSVIDSLPVILMAVSKKGIITICRGMGLKPFGIKPDSVVGQSLYRYFNKEHQIIEILNEGLKYYRPFTKVIKYKKRFFQVTVSPTIDNKGAVSGISCVASDISSKVKMEEEQAILSAAVEHATESVIITDRYGKIIYVNPAFEAVSGFLKDEAVGQNPNILKSGFHDDYFYKDLWTSIQKGKVWNGYLTNKAKDGSYFEEEASISPVFNRTGTIQYFVAVKRDVTQERKMELQLRKAQKMEAIGTLAGGIAHDFNNILFPIIGFTELLACNIKDENRRYIDNILSAAYRAKDLIHQILTFSRQNEETKKPVKIHVIVKEALKLLRASIPSIIDIRYEFDKSDSPVMADPVKIHQIIMNLGTNAYHSMEKSGGILSISLKQVDINEENLQESFIIKNTFEKYIKLTIKDTGEGIDNDIVDKIFDPYFTTKPQGKGTGLGLSTVHGIVQSCDGYINVQSQKGKGSAFNIYLPAISENNGLLNDYIEEIAPSGTEHILIVDDEQLIVEVIEDILNGLGYKTTVTTSSVDALKLFRTRSDEFDLMVTDLTMPNMKGTELAEEIHKIKPDFPIIICSGFSEIETRNKTKNTGISSFIMKPVLKKELAEAVRKSIDEKNKKN